MIDGEWEELKRDWCNNEITVKRICEKYNFNSNDFYESIHNRLIEDTGFIRRKKSTNPPSVKRKIKNYYESKGKFTVQKRINGENIRYGTYNSENIAKAIVSKLKEVDWDKSELPRIRKELDVKVENNKKPIDMDLYLILKNDYISCKYSIREICEMRGINYATWVRYLKQIKKETAFRRPFGRYTGSNPRYYSFHWDDMKYHITKTLNNKTVHFGSYKHEEECKKIVQKLIAVNWDKSKLKEIVDEVCVL